MCVTFFHVTRAPVRVDTATEVPSNFSVTDSPAVPDIQWQRVSFPARWISGYQSPFISTCEWRAETNTSPPRPVAGAPAASATTAKNVKRAMANFSMRLLYHIYVRVALLRDRDERGATCCDRRQDGG